MKILIVYTPRSKSTMVHDVVSQRFGLEPMREALTRSRRAQQNFDEFPDIIHRMNTEDNICVKITGGNDFIDLPNRRIRPDYKTIDYASFDRVILISRRDYVSAVMSYAYMDQLNDRSWHRRRGENKLGHAYTVSDLKIYYMLRGYAVFDHVSQYIADHMPPDRLLRYDFDTAETQLAKDFGLDPQDFEIDIVPNELDYRALAHDSEKTVSTIHDVYNYVMSLSIDQINHPDTRFWSYSDQSIL